MKNQYAIWPGWTREDNKVCLACKWHSILEGRYVCCDYSISDQNKVRNCKGGVGCNKFEPGRNAGKSQPGKQKRRKRADMADINIRAYEKLVKEIGRTEMARISGVTPRAVSNWRKRRIKRVYAQRILEATGVDMIREGGTNEA